MLSKHFFHSSSNEVVTYSLDLFLEVPSALPVSTNPFMTIRPQEHVNELQGEKKDELCPLFSRYKECQEMGLSMGPWILSSLYSGCV
jgi:hypothetical protein